MKRMLFALVAISVLILAATPAGAIDDNAGTAGYSFLKIGVGARAAAMGNAYVALADDHAALYHNPAGITGMRLAPDWGAATPAVRATYVAASYNSWVSDLQSGFLALTKPIGEESWLGASIQYLSFGNLTETDIDGTVLGEFNASDFAFALTGAKRFSDNVSLGLTGRLIMESIQDSTSWGLAADIGLMYHLDDGRTQIGLAATNLGAQMKGLTESHKDELPLKIAVGASHRLEGLPLILAAEINKATDDGVRFSLGSELVSLAPFYFRAGFSSRRHDIETGSSSDDWSGFSGGLGVLYNQIRIDYALGRLSDLGTVHRIGLTARL